jgi:hypothetical protein
MYNVVSELVALVGGSANNNQKSAAGKNRRTLTHTDHTFHQIASGKKSKTKNNKAEEIIPLHAGEDNSFDDFIS